MNNCYICNKSTNHLLEKVCYNKTGAMHPKCYATILNQTIPSYCKNSLEEKARKYDNIVNYFKDFPKSYDNWYDSRIDDLVIIKLQELEDLKKIMGDIQRFLK